METQKALNHREIVSLPNVELSKRCKTALDEFIQAVRQGNEKVIMEKTRIYQAYEDERLKRLDITRNKYSHVS